MSEVMNDQSEIVPAATTIQTVILARQSHSTLEKIALWASAINTIAGVGGVITLKLLANTVSSDMLKILVCALLSLILLTTRVRWAPLVSTLLSLILLYAMLTQPFVVASLTDPHGPNGGIGKFIGLVFNIAVGLVLFGASLGATVQVWHPTNYQTPCWLFSGWALLVGMILGAIFIGVISQPAITATGPSFTNGVPTVHLIAGGFVQASVDIAKGSKLLLVDDSTSQHDLFNGSWQSGTPLVKQEPGAPLVQNLILSGNSATIGPFVTAGTYHIFCTIHQGMNLTINVQ